MTFQRVIYNQTQYIATVAQGNSSHAVTHVLPSYGDGLVRHDDRHRLRGERRSSSSSSLIVFGRLEGNFAEEL